MKACPDKACPCLHKNYPPKAKRQEPKQRIEGQKPACYYDYFPVAKSISMLPPIVHCCIGCNDADSSSCSKLKIAEIQSSEHIHYEKWVGDVDSKIYQEQVSGKFPKMIVGH